LPPFAYPHKRYVRQQIVERVASYTEDDAATYRSASEDGGLAIFHEAAPAGASPDDRTLAPSTVWRWITSLSDLRETLSRALEMVRARSPDSLLFRQALLVPARKYRSEKRREHLELVRRLVHTDVEYRPLFGGSLFPGVARATGFR